MSQENVDRALELIDAFKRRNLDAFMALTHVQIYVETSTRGQGRVVVVPGSKSR
jgi:hypothetical protein